MRATSKLLRSPQLAARAILVLALASFVCLGSGALSAARSRHAGRHTTKAAPGTVHVIEHAVTDTTVQSGGPGDVTGNILTFHNKVFDTRDVSQVGRDQGYCIRISPAEGSYECNWTTFLAHGQITVEGPFYDTRNSVLAITGGTGAYRRARGEMNLISRHGGTEYDFIFHLN